MMRAARTGIARNEAQWLHAGGVVHIGDQDPENGRWVTSEIANAVIDPQGVETGALPVGDGRRRQPRPLEIAVSDDLIVMPVGELPRLLQGKVENVEARGKRRLRNGRSAAVAIVFYEVGPVVSVPSFLRTRVSSPAA